MMIKVSSNLNSVTAYSVTQLRRDNPHTAFPPTLPPELLAAYGVYEVAPTKPPIFDGATSRLIEGEPQQVDGAWVQTWRVEYLPLADAVAGKKAQIKKACDLALEPIRSAYPDTERATWDMQRQEALAWKADNAAAIPFIAALATERGLTPAEQATRILTKLAAYQQTAALAVGKRQRLEDAVEAIAATAAMTEEEKVAAISEVAW